MTTSPSRLVPLHPGYYTSSFQLKVVLVEKLFILSSVPNYCSNSSSFLQTPLSSTPEYRVKTIFIASITERWSHVSEFWPEECGGKQTVPLSVLTPRDRLRYFSLALDCFNIAQRKECNQRIQVSQRCQGARWSSIHEWLWHKMPLSSKSLIGIILWYKGAYCFDWIIPLRLSGSCSKV